MSADTIATIGDLTVSVDGGFAYVAVDGETVICIPRHGHGLDELAQALEKAVITDEEMANVGGRP